MPETFKPDPKTAGDEAQSLSARTNPISSGFSHMFAPQTGPLAPGLYLVSTPIGNLRDITLRALDVLSSADQLLAEDTRHTRKLFQAYGLTGSLSPYHDHNAAKRVDGIIKSIEGGASVALVSDAGTPVVSDPGFRLARAAVEAGLPVFAVPGASAVLAGLVSSGLPSDKFCFAGFMPPKSGARKTALSSLTSVPASLIFFESAGRLSACLADMQAVLGDRQACVARELTKKYEQLFHGSISSIVDCLAGTKLKGEIVVIVGPPEISEKWDQAAVDEALRGRVAQVGVKQASTEIAEFSGHAKRDVYARAVQIKNE